MQERSSLKVAYCLLVHTNPKQGARLIKRIYSRDDFFYVHVFTKKGAPFHEWEQIGDFGENMVLVQSKYGPSRGRFGLVAATLDAMNRFAGCSYDYFVNLSGQSYPLKSAAEIKNQLGTNLAYMRYDELPYVDWGVQGGLDRIHNYWFRLGDRNIRIPRIHKRLPHNLRPYGSSQWFCLPRRFIDFILAFISDEPRILDFFRRSRIPEEIFFSTIIMNSKLSGQVINDDKCYVRWSPKPNRSHPLILETKDFNELKVSSDLFARKFDIEVDENILDLLDKEIDAATRMQESIDVGIPDTFKSVSPAPKSMLA